MDGQTGPKEPALYEYTIIRENDNLAPAHFKGHRHTIEEHSMDSMLTIYNDETGGMYVASPGRWIDFFRTPVGQTGPTEEQKAWINRAVFEQSKDLDSYQ